MKETRKPTPVLQQVPTQPTIILSAKPPIAATDINNKPFLVVKPDYKPNAQAASK